MGVIDAGESDDAVKEVRPAEKEIAGVVGPHGKARGEHLLSGAVDLPDAGGQLVGEITDPGLVAADPVIGIAADERDGLGVDGIRSKQLQAAAFQIVAQRLQHAEALPVEKASVLAGKHHHRFAAVAVHLEFHVTAQMLAEFLVVFCVHDLSSFCPPILP